MTTTVPTAGDEERLVLSRCPFCGATPHRGPTKVQHDQLHGEPFQRYAIWCPHGCARIERMNEQQAAADWNNRPDADADATITRLRQERDEARGIVREVHWMAVRYADGRRSYAPGMCNDALRKAYDAGWLTYQRSSDHDLDPQYAREGDKPEYRSIEARAEAAEAALTASNAEAERLREALRPEVTEAEIEDAVLCVKLGLSAGVADAVNVGAALRRFAESRARALQGSAKQ